jgi:hypothetical protein
MNNLVIPFIPLVPLGNIDIGYIILSGIVGYIFAWFYLKSVYRKKIKIIKMEKFNMNNQLVNKIITINALNRKSRHKDSIVEYLIKKIAWLKSSQKKSLQDIENKIIS